MDPTKRIFIALNLPPEMRAVVERAQQRLRYLPGAHAMRWTRPEQVHLTLEFLGNVSSSAIPELISAVQSAVIGITPLRLALEGAGCFPSNAKPSVVWLGMSGDIDRLTDMQRKI